MRTVVSVSLSKDLAVELQKTAKAEGKSKSGVIKEALRSYIWESKFMALRKKMTRKAETKGILTDEDVFKAVS
ncbi:MAG: ribbon-helix-helix protein, CopG family [Nitrospirae bacterium]|nr:ribbon-helix-helix protein, CopG family [Nitrospirota bacterium]